MDPLGGPSSQGQPTVTVTHPGEPAPPPDAEADGPDPLIGRAIGGYRITQRIGKGGMGVVYLGVHPALERRVAIKVLLPELAGHLEVRRRFLDEARAVAALDSPHVVAVRDLAELPDGRAYIVMEYLEGESLYRMWKRRGPLPAGEAVAIAVEALAGLAAAHAHGIVHRDVKPANLFITRGAGPGQVKILDFGIAKLRDRPAGATRAGSVLGTPEYMSPEQASGNSARVDPRADLYALGIVLYELLTGRVPFASDDWGQLIILHRQAAPPPMQLARPELEAAVTRALAKAPEDRFPDADAMRAELERALGEPLPPVPSPELTPLPPPPAPAADQRDTSELRVPEVERPTSPLRPPELSPPPAETPRVPTERRGWLRLAVVLLVLVPLAGLVGWLATREQRPARAGLGPDAGRAATAPAPVRSSPAPLEALRDAAVAEARRDAALATSGDAALADAPHETLPHRPAGHAHRDLVADAGVGVGAPTGAATGELCVTEVSAGGRHHRLGGARRQTGDSEPGALIDSMPNGPGISCTSYRQGPWVGSFLSLPEGLMRLGQHALAPPAYVAISGPGLDRMGFDQSYRSRQDGRFGTVELDELAASPGGWVAGWFDVDLSSWDAPDSGAATVHVHERFRYQR